MLSLTWVSAAPAVHKKSVSSWLSTLRTYKPPIQLRILKATKLRKSEPSVSTAAGVHQQHKNDSENLLPLNSMVGRSTAEVKKGPDRLLSFQSMGAYSGFTSF